MGMLIHIRRFREWRSSKFVLAGISAAVFLFVIMLYIIDFTVNRMGGRNITYDVVLANIHQLSQLSEILPFSINMIYLLLAGLVLLIFALYARLSRAIFEGLSELFLPERKFSFFRDRNRAIKSFIVLGLLLLSFA
jgi:hypothetical protein